VFTSERASEEVVTRSSMVGNKRRRGARRVVLPRSRPEVDGFAFRVLTSRLFSNAITSRNDIAVPSVTPARAMPPEEDFSDDESYYVPAGTSPPRVVRGPSVKDMQLYGSENGDLLRAQRARQLALRQQGAEHARLIAAMRRRQGQTPVEAIRTRIQCASRRHIAKELDPETVRRRAASVDSSADVFRHAAVDRRGTDDGMRHLPEVSYGTRPINPDPAATMARRVARQLAKVQAPHPSWEGASRKTKRLSSLPT